MADQNKTNTTSAEELEKQRQFQQQQQAQMLRYQRNCEIAQAIMSLDAKTVLENISKRHGTCLMTPNVMLANQILQGIHNNIFNAEVDNDTIVKLSKVAIASASCTMSLRNQYGYGMGMNPMMGGMGMNPMMGGGMPGMGMGYGMDPSMSMGYGMNPMMGGMNYGMGMNPMMGGMGYGMGYGMNQMPGMQQNPTDKADDEAQRIERCKATVKQYLTSNGWMPQMDPLIFMQTAITFGLNLDFSADQQLSNLISQAIAGAIQQQQNPAVFNQFYFTIAYLKQNDMWQRMQQNQQNSGNNQNGQQNNMYNQYGYGMNYGMGMNPMMGGMNYGMGMNPMMGGMGMDPSMSMGMMNGGMSGMNYGMGMNPMMGGMGMNPMMGGMNYGMGMMPGMQNQFQQSSNNAFV